MNIIGEEFDTLLVNARHIKNVPGRKTDVQDAEWICKLLRAGLLKKSFIPPTKIVKLRNLTRYQKKLKYQERDERSRVHKVLQQANIKITSVLSNIFGVAGLKILKDLASGITDPKELSKYITNSRYVYKKKDQAIEALEGKFCKEDQFMLKVMLENIFHTQNQILVIEKKDSITHERASKRSRIIANHTRHRREVSKYNYIRNRSKHGCLSHCKSSGLLDWIISH